MTAPELRQLNRIRLDENLSYRQLAHQVSLPERTLFRILNTPNARVYDRTLHKVKTYLHARDRQRSDSQPHDPPMCLAHEGV